MIFASFAALWALSGPSCLHAAPSAPEALAEASVEASFQRGRKRSSQKKSAPKRSGRSSGRRILGGAQSSAPGKSKRGADDERGSEPRRAVVLPVPQSAEEQIRGWFETADYDHNGWISFREARQSLGFDRTRYRVYDLDRDGRMPHEEFEAYHADSVRLGSRFRTPRAAAGDAKPPTRSPEVLRNAYDRDLDGHLGELELAHVLADYRREDVPADVVLTSLDGNRDERLDLVELVGLAGILHPIVLPVEGEDEEPRAEMPEKPTTIDELFGRMLPRNEGSTASPAPPLLPGPVPVFRRLDLDNDGRISQRDLDLLRRPLQLRLRVHSVISTLDRDGDGSLTLGEFESALAGFER